MTLRQPYFIDRRVAVYSYLSLREEVDNAVLYALEALGNAGYIVVFTSRIRICPKQLSAYADHIIVADKGNSPFLAWAHAFAHFPDLYKTREIVLTHDGVFGPMGSLSAAHALMEQRECAVWSVTHNAVATTLRPHYLAFKQAAVTHPFFRSFWDTAPKIPFSLQEAAFHNALRQSGLDAESLSNVHGTLLTSPRPELEEWRHVITGGGLFIDKRVFLTPSRIDESGWTRLVAWTGYPIRYIAEYFSARGIDISATLPSGRRADPWPPNILALKTQLRTGNARRSASLITAAAFVHAYYTDVFDELVDYLRNLPVFCDIHISTDTQDKKRLLQDKTRLLQHAVFIHQVKNKGFDIYPFLCVFGETVFSYDVILKIHAKKSWHLSESESASWRRSLYASLLGSSKRVETILECFQRSPDLGMIVPNFSDEYIERLAFGEDYEPLRHYLNRMGIDPDPNTLLDFPMGSMFWCRPAALNPLFSLEFSEDRFTEADNSMTHGTVAHHVERLFLFSCAAAGLRWARALPERRLYQKPTKVRDQQNNAPLMLPPSVYALYATGVLPLPAEGVTPHMQGVLFVDYYLYCRNEYPLKNFAITKEDLTCLRQEGDRGFPLWLELMAEAESRRQKLDAASPVSLFVRLILRRKLNLESLCSLITTKFENILFGQDGGREFRACCETIITEERPDILEGADQPETMLFAFCRWWVAFGLEDYPLLFKYYIERSALTEKEQALAAKGLPFAIQLVYRARPDLQKAFPNYSVPEVLQWWSNRGPVEYPTFYSAYNLRLNTVALTEPGSGGVIEKEQHETASQGVNIIGLVKAELGIAEDTRMAAKALKSANVPFSLLDAPVPTSSRQQDNSLEEYISPGLPHSVNIVYLPAVETIRLLARQGFDFFKGRYTICNWQWELPYWPTALNHCLALPQEIWAPSRYIYEALEPVAAVPLHYMPMAVELPSFTPKSRTHFNIPEENFCFLLVYDGFSWTPRKNPQAVIDAFTLAFPEEKHVCLVVKSMNCDEQTPEYARIARAAAVDTRIRLINATFSRSDALALFNACDAYVSLHRAEGFGRTIAEAMLLGKPVIVSSFSGNMDFCAEEGAFLVNGRKVPVKEGEYPYYDGQYWFEPSVEDAATQMRHCLYDKAMSAMKAARGQSIIQTLFSPESVGRRYAQRLASLEDKAHQEYKLRHPFTLLHPA